MYKSIVVGTDGSERAGIAVGCALDLARMTEATLHAVHAAPRGGIATEFVDGAGVPMTRAAIRHDGDRILARIVDWAKREGVTAITHNVDGAPADVLTGVAETVDADLVVVGNRGMSGVQRFVLGSVANSVSHHCPCSLLIVNTDATQV